MATTDSSPGRPAPSCETEWLCLDCDVEPLPAICMARHLDGPCTTVVRLA